MVISVNSKSVVEVAHLEQSHHNDSARISILFTVFTLLTTRATSPWQK